MKSRQHQNKTPAALPDLKDGASRGVKGENMQTIPTVDPQEARKSAAPFLMVAMEEMNSGNMYSSDFAWANRILTYPVWLHATWDAQGQNIEAAQKHIMSSIFGLKV